MLRNASWAAPTRWHDLEHVERMIGEWELDRSRLRPRVRRGIRLEAAGPSALDSALSAALDQP